MSLFIVAAVNIESCGRQNDQHGSGCNHDLFWENFKDRLPYLLVLHSAKGLEGFSLDVIWKGGVLGGWLNEVVVDLRDLLNI